MDIDTSGDITPQISTPTQQYYFNLLLIGDVDLQLIQNTDGSLQYNNEISFKTVNYDTFSAFQQDANSVGLTLEMYFNIVVLIRIEDDEQNSTEVALNVAKKLRKYLQSVNVDNEKISEVENVLYKREMA